ncbi:hypothetical protein [Alkalimarinus alittae]|uniref:Uncharacterized protein n=1 Tax=Alkalimarinus alittae TaxID=2961619 RepID=A0ABY6MXT9_9ALTE|nr:hypothetical protein [Alkalimarinus alittae]UZE94607.1 hypothetical protein NKI27_10960 [Alkalimarinus alittae]
MAKNDKLGIDKIINRINQEFEKTSSHFDKLVSDAQKQFDTLQGQIQDPIKKLMEDMDAVRERELKRFHSEFDRRVEEFTELQNNILEKLGVNAKADNKPTKAATKNKTASTTTTTKKTPAKSTTKAAEKKPAAKKAPPQKTAAKKPAAKKTTATKKPATAKTTTAKPAAKKPAAKKTTAKKPAAKKPAAKKPAAQKSAATKPASKKTDANKP